MSHFKANKVPFFASVFVKVDMCCFVEFKLNQNAISLDICCTNSIEFEIFKKKFAPKNCPFLLIRKKEKNAF